MFTFEVDGLCPKRLTEFYQLSVGEVDVVVTQETDQQIILAQLVTLLSTICRENVRTVSWSEPGGGNAPLILYICPE